MDWSFIIYVCAKDYGTIILDFCQFVGYSILISVLRILRHTILISQFVKSEERISIDFSMHGLTFMGLAILSSVCIEVDGAH